MFCGCVVWYVTCSEMFVSIRLNTSVQLFIIPCSMISSVVESKAFFVYKRNTYVLYSEFNKTVQLGKMFLRVFLWHKCSLVFQIICWYYYHEMGYYDESSMEILGAIPWNLPKILSSLFTQHSSENVVGVRTDGNSCADIHIPASLVHASSCFNDCCGYAKRITYMFWLIFDYVSSCFDFWFLYSL